VWTDLQERAESDLPRWARFSGKLGKSVEEVCTSIVTIFLIFSLF
jgi:hypothetical protein